MRADQTLRDPTIGDGMSLTSDEMNYLVYRYLLESGFTHAAFALGHESRVDGARVADGDGKIPPGALIAFVQKGLQYCELEANLNEVRDFRNYFASSSSSRAWARVGEGFADRDSNANSDAFAFAQPRAHFRRKWRDLRNFRAISLGCARY